jgi:hypothetical protein
MVLPIVALYAGFKGWAWWISAIIFAVAFPILTFLQGRIIGISSEVLMRIMLTQDFASRMALNLAFFFIAYGIGYGFAAAIRPYRSR